jgi:SAM-dependent methyltransferase
LDIKESEQLSGSEGDHWYYRSKLKAVQRLLNGRTLHKVLDVGAGSGFFSRQLLAASSVDEAWCVDLNYLDESDISESGKPIHFRKSIDRVDADLVLLMDVLEHVDDDAGLLREYIGKARADATFVISVPAFNFMWSPHDDFLGHKRRYTLADIEKVVAACGLRVESSTYFYAAVFPIAFAVRMFRKLFGAKRAPMSDMKTHARPVDAALYTMSTAELGLLPHNRAFGLTAFCVARKPS